MSMKWLTEKSKSRLRMLLIAAMCAMVALLSAGCALLPDEDEEEILPEITPPKLSQKPVYTVTTETLETKVRGIGELKSLQQENLFFVNGGRRVKEVHVRTGDAVTAGQLLAELDVSELERDLRQKKLRFRSNELQMIETLRKADQLSPEELEQAKIDFELARSELTELEERIENAKLHAPFDGTVVSVSISPGDTPNDYETVMTIADLNQLVVAAKFKASDLESVAVGMDAIVTINTVGEFRGKVGRLPVARESQNNPQNPQRDTLDQYLLVDIEPFPEGLQLGTPLSVTVITDRKENAVVIPVSALRTYSGRNYVQVQEDDGTKREVDVEIGRQTSTLVEIVKGLEPGQKVVGR